MVGRGVHEPMPVRDPAFPPGSLHAPEGLFPVAFPRGPGTKDKAQALWLQGGGVQNRGRLGAQVRAGPGSPGNTGPLHPLLSPLDPPCPLGPTGDLGFSCI